jgi:hypothetical protein
MRTDSVSPSAFDREFGRMNSKRTLEHRDRPRRYALHLPVYFRELNSPNWLEGKTENISSTGILLRSSSPLAQETQLDLRLQVSLGTRGSGPIEIRCKCKVVRLEERLLPENPIAVAVKIGDYRIVGGPQFSRNPSGNA